MGYHLLNDREHNVAVIYDTTDGRALTHEVFEGASSLEQGESFMGFLLARAYDNLIGNDFHAVEAGRLPEPTDPRAYSPQGLDKVVEQWRAACWDKVEGELNEYGWQLYEWFNGTRASDPPARPSHLRVVS